MHQVPLLTLSSSAAGPRDSAAPSELDDGGGGLAVQGLAPLAIDSFEFGIRIGEFGITNDE